MELCPQCHTTVLSADGDCASCKTSSSVNPYEVSPAVQDISVTVADSGSYSQDDYIKAFIGEKYLSYFPYAGNGIKGWNWAAFFFGSMWLVYRKMYLFAGIYIALRILMVVLLLIVGLPDGVDNLLGIMISVAFGALGNKLYAHSMNRKIASIVAFTPKNQTIPALVTAGGTNHGAVAVVFFIFCLAAFGLVSMMNG